jgi:hypothetical protein
MQYHKEQLYNVSKSKVGKSLGSTCDCEDQITDPCGYCAKDKGIEGGEASKEGFRSLTLMLFAYERRLPFYSQQVKRSGLEIFDSFKSCYV